HYVELARGKGLRTSTILLKHILRNAFIRIFIDSKFVLWFMLSNLFMVEYLLNVRGLIAFMFHHPSLTVFTVGLLMIFIPIFLLLAIGQVIIEKITAQEVEL